MIDPSGTGLTVILAKLCTLSDCERVFLLRGNKLALDSGERVRSPLPAAYTMVVGSGKEGGVTTR